MLARDKQEIPEKGWGTLTGIWVPHDAARLVKAYAEDYNNMKRITSCCPSIHPNS
jgi:hypothetical protein